MPITEDEAREFTQRALAKGVSQDEIKAALEREGVWSVAGPPDVSPETKNMMSSAWSGVKKSFNPELWSALVQHYMTPRGQFSGSQDVQQFLPNEQEMHDLGQLGMQAGKTAATYAAGYYGGRLLPSIPWLGSVLSQGLTQSGGEAAREKISGEPFQPWRVLGEGATVAGTGAVQAGTAGVAAKMSGVNPEAMRMAYTNPRIAFKPPTTAERVGAVERLQAGAEDALKHPSPGKNRLNWIIDEADKRMGKPANTTAGNVTPAGMVDGRVLVQSLRKQVKGAGDSATRAAEQTIASEANDMLGKVADRAVAHPQNAPNIYNQMALKAPNGQRYNLDPSKPLWITHREYDDLLREHMTKPSTPVNQAAAPTITTIEDNANTLRNAARAEATQHGYRELNREGVTYPSASGPVTAQQAGMQAKNYMQTIERIKAYFPKGKPSKPASGGVTASEQAGDAMLNADPSELGYRIEQSLKDYAQKTGDWESYNKFHEIALRGEFARREAQPYLANMARIFIRPGGASVVERVPISRRTAGFMARRTARPVTRSLATSAASEALVGQQRKPAPREVQQDSWQQILENAMRNSP